MKSTTSLKLASSALIITDSAVAQFTEDDAKEKNKCHTVAISMVAKRIQGLIKFFYCSMSQLLRNAMRPCLLQGKD